jgi:hypothetical protein
MSRIEFILAALLVIMNHDVRPRTAAPGLPPCKLVFFSGDWSGVEFKLQDTSVKLQVFFGNEP